MHTAARAGRNSRHHDHNEARKRSAVGYVRRSTDRQEQSIPDQKKAIERYAEEQGLRLQRFYVDDAISGTSTVGRRAFMQLIEDASGGRAEGDFAFVLVYDVKRFGRVDNDEAGYYRHILKQAGVEVVYVTEGFNGGETDDLLRPVKQWQARQESKDLSKVTIRGLLSKGSSGGGGAWLGGTPPHGYDLRYENDRGEVLFVLRYMPDGSKRMLDEKGRLIRTLERGESVSVSKRDHAKLVPGDSARIATIKRIFHLYTREGRGLSAVSDVLNREETPTARGPAWSHIYCGKWRDSTVRAILVNPLYAGDMVWNRRTDGRFHSISKGRAVERKTPHGARLVPNPESDWIIVRDAHAPLIDRRTFELAQSVRQDRPSSATQRGQARSWGGGAGGGWNGARARFLLSGLVRCARCGSRYQGVTRTKGRPRKDGSPVRTFSYGCGGYIAKGKSTCEFNPVGQQVLEELVVNAVLAFYAKYQGDPGQKALLAAVRAHVGFEAADIAQARRRLEGERNDVEDKIARLLDSMGPEMKPETREMMDARLAELRQQREALAVRTEELNRLAAAEGQVAEMANEVGHYVAGLDFTLKHGLNEEKQTALRRAVVQVELDRPKGELSLRLRSLPLPAVGEIAVESLMLELREPARGSR